MKWSLANVEQRRKGQKQNRKSGNVEFSLTQILPFVHAQTKCDARCVNKVQFILDGDQKMSWQASNYWGFFLVFFRENFQGINGSSGWPVVWPSIAVAPDVSFKLRWTFNKLMLNRTSITVYFHCLFVNFTFTDYSRHCGPWERYIHTPIFISQHRLRTPDHGSSKFISKLCGRVFWSCLPITESRNLFFNLKTRIKSYVKNF